MTERIESEEGLLILPSVLLRAMRLSEEYMPSEKKMDFAHVLARWIDMIRRGKAIVLYEDKDGVLLSVLAGFVVVDDHREEKRAVVWHWVSKTGAGRFMLKEFKEWAKSKGAIGISISCHADTYTDRTERLYRKLGFKQTGVVYEGIL